MDRSKIREELIKLKGIDFESTGWKDIIEQVESIKDAIYDALREYSPSRSLLYDLFPLAYSLTAQNPNELTKKRFKILGENGKLRILPSVRDNSEERESGNFLLSEKVEIEGSMYSVIIKHPREKTRKLIDWILYQVIQREIEFTENKK